MKNLFLFICVFSFISVSFVSCSDGKVRAKEMIKGKWIMQSMTMKSNCQGVDKAVNSGFSKSLETANLSMTFETDSVITSVNAKNDFSKVYKEEVDEYYFKKNMLHIHSTLGMFIAHSFKISENVCILRCELDQTSLAVLLFKGGFSDSIRVSIPANFSGTLTYTLKR